MLSTMLLSSVCLKYTMSYCDKMLSLPDTTLANKNSWKSYLGFSAALGGLTKKCCGLGAKPLT